jgi:DNA-binding transcriptional LysR family regulator
MYDDLNLNQLRVFHTVARVLNFTRAADELHLTQPGISKHIKGLEAFYGTRLFDRLGKKVVLTQAGEILFKASGAMAELLQESRARMHDLRGLAGGKLRLGASITIGTYLLPALLVKFRNAFPEVDIKVDIALSQQVVDKVLNNTLEIGFVGHHAEDRRLTAFPFRKEKMVLAVAPEHPWAARTSPVRLKELSGQPFLLSREGSGTRTTLSALLDKAGIALENTMELGTAEGVKQAVEANLGVSILSHHVIAKDLATGAIQAVRLAGGAPTRQLSGVYHKDRYLSAAARAFMEIARAV